MRRKRADTSNWVYLIILLAILLLGLVLVIQAFSSQDTLHQTVYFQTNPDEIVISSPSSGTEIASPLTIRGRAMGSWFFEAVFQATLVNWDGLIITESYVTATSDWMSENLVRFEGIIEFEIPYEPSEDIPEFMKRGTLILRKANPSGLPEHDGAIEVPVWFE